MQTIDRRQALGLLGFLILSGCGGGGGGGAETGTSEADVAPAPAPAATSPAATAPVVLPNLSRNIAAWGDSLTGPVVVNLRQIYAERTVFNGGVIGETSAQIAARERSDTEHETWINIFWYGHNNQTQAAQIRADLAASVSRLAPGNTHFIVMSVVNQATPEEQRGGIDYQTIIDLNQSLAAAYPSNYLDIRKVLVNSFNPANGQDRVDFANDVPPLSLRFDMIHLNNEGSVVVAQEIKKFIESKGW